MKRILDSSFQVNPPRNHIELVISMKVNINIEDLNSIKADVVESRVRQVNGEDQGLLPDIVLAPPRVNQLSRQRESEERTPRKNEIEIGREISGVSREEGNRKEKECLYRRETEQFNPFMYQRLSELRKGQSDFKREKECVGFRKIRKREEGEEGEEGNSTRKLIMPDLNNYKSNQRCFMKTPEELGPRNLFPSACFENPLKKRESMETNGENTTASIFDKLRQLVAQQIVPETIDTWDFKILNQFFESYYLKKDFQTELVDKFNIKEKIVFLKMIGIRNEYKQMALQDSKLLLSLAQQTLMTDKDEQKAYKVTNSKRFVYRKIKTIMYQEFKKKEFRRHLSKKDVDYQFFTYYFKNQPEYAELCDIEKKVIETLYFTYKESKIDLIWRFAKFTRDFTVILKRFPDELHKSYYTPKYETIKIFLESLNGKDVEYLRGVRPPCKKLPLNHCVIDLYISDFIKAFGKYLNK